MKILRLVLENFQGIKDFTIEPNGAKVSIYGDNGTGKTTIANAVTWLLTGKSANNEKGYSPKTTDEFGNPIHNLEHSVEIVFQLENGQQITLKKVFKEIWTKKRGSLAEEQSGHTTDYYIDGVPMGTEREFADRLNDICPADKMRLLTTPEYFPNELSWQDRRKILLEVCGDVTDEDVINNTPTLKDLGGYLLKPGTTDQYYIVDDYFKIATAKKTEINKNLVEIPSRIDEATKAIPDVGNLKMKDIETLIATLQGKKSAKEQEKMNLQNTDANKVLQGQISNLQLELSQARNEHSKKYEESVQVVREEITTIRNNISTATNDLYGMESGLTLLRNKLHTMQCDRKELSDKYIEWKDRIWAGDETCVACGQPLPTGEIEDLKAKFNTLKSETMESIRSRIASTCSKILIAALEAQIANSLESVLAKQKLLEDLNLILSNKQKGITEKIHFDSSEDYIKITNKISEIQVKISEGSTDLLEQSLAIQNEINSILDKIEVAISDKITLQSVDVQNKRISDLKAQQKVLSTQYELIEKGIYLCDLFTMSKVSMLDEKINSKFDSVKFKLFHKQENGGIAPTCEVVCVTPLGLKEWKQANDGARVNAGLECIDVLSRHWGLEMPVIVDNAESVTRLKNMETQVIRLVVSEQDKILRIEVQG